jgi:Ser/Thr protein kinase RdoA (MazF antagonist)
MMKLQHLHDQRDMVHHILRRWAHDADRLDWLDRYRISANAVYPFSSGGQLHFLRFAPASEKRAGQIEAELAWLEALGANGLEVCVPVPSLSGKHVERVETDWGACLACVFKGAEGQRLDWMAWDPLPEDALRAAGRTLAELHRLSERFGREQATRQPDQVAEPSPWSWSEVLDWCERTVAGIPMLPEGALGLDDDGELWPSVPLEAEQYGHAVQALRETLAAMPCSPETHGRIHYDFEMDNLFWQPGADRCIPIDFDDCMLHLYGMDVHKSLESIRETLADKREEAEAARDSDTSDCEADAIADVDWEQRYGQASALFLEGYRTIRPIPADLTTHRAIHEAFAAAFGYARCVYAVQHVDENEPEWQTGLRTHLRHFMEERGRVLFRS